MKFKYISPLDSENAKMVIEKVELRKQVKNKLKQVKSDMREIGRVLHGYSGCKGSGIDRVRGMETRGKETRGMM